MHHFLHLLSSLPTPIIWLIFLVENVIITAMTLYAGMLISGHTYQYTSREWQICIMTNILNTIVTFAGWWLWQEGYITIDMNFTLGIFTDVFLLFFAMDLLMYLFHWLIHKTFLYRLFHKLHHQSIHPKPIDLFVLHPIETIAFGGLWLLLLWCLPFNIYAIMIYLVVNVIFGLTGHLGIEPLPAKIRYLPVIRLLGTSTFHHDHHQDISHNFGFYTSIWDRFFGTYKEH
jgi:sterol desaturase/sphingolipid hydroxylase (fatty acid hydroxylase superfamily)